MSDNRLYLACLGVIGLVVGFGVFTEYQTEQTARVCIEQGNEWVDDSCVQPK